MSESEAARRRSEVPRTSRPTQADVARLAGVSQSLVSYVLNDTPVSVPESTRRRVQEAMRQLGYIPNHAARALRTQRTMTLALMIPDITNPFYPAVERGVQETAEDAGYQLFTYNTDGAADKERAAVESLRNHGRADGVIVYDFHLTAADLTSLLESGIAVVLAASSADRLGDVPVDRLIVDTAAGAERITTYLLDKGHVPPATIAGSLDTEAGTARLSGYRRALAARSVDVVPEYVVESDFTYEGGRAAMEALLALPHPPGAVFAANDLMALGALGAARERDLRVPEDIAVAGFDDIDPARMVTPRLTTVRQPQREIGRQLARLLLERLADGQAAPRRVEAELELVVRESA